MSDVCSGKAEARRQLLVLVAVPVPNLDLLTYSVPDGAPAPAIGARVVVPLGPRVVAGIIVEVKTENPEPGTGNREPGNPEGNREPKNP